MERSQISDVKRYFPESLKRPLRIQLRRLLGYKKKAMLLLRKGSQRWEIQKYLRDHSVVKVSLGAGKHAKREWLNTDYEPFGDPAIIYLDAAKPFPFADGSVDYFYSEHMIEHLPLSSAQAMLKECYRALRVGGRVRIATPDMMQIASVLFSRERPDVSEYIQWALEAFPPRVAPSTRLTSCMVFNNFMRDWGHQFVYDEDTLGALLEEAGFKKFCRCSIDSSDDPQLVGQEMHHLITGAMANSFETLVMEAVK